ncbi:MAG: prepilin-type N-terminal cleavage/methylation domain-containing protein [Spongiibacteraceae bacterium]|nr:prepilin-type N-terminal cleavage/methylation domain-containing protein [Spongiibacteraceae bacterium]
MQHQANGFSLVEILIVMAIIGIIAAVATPSYQAYVMKSSRSEAYAALNEIMQAQERFAADNGTYSTDLTDLGYLASQPSERGLYNISAEVCGGAVIASCVLLRAAADSGRSQINDLNDGSGGHIDTTLDSRGTRAGW